MFNDKEKIDLLKYSKGLKYFLNGYVQNQNEIEEFVNMCKKMKIPMAWLHFFNLEINSRFQFLNGPFKNLIFDIIENQKRN